MIVTFSVDFNNQPLTNLPEPVNDSDAATKKYVDDHSGASTGLESYQNSAMSAPVQAYVFRDADNNITRVYEPLRNNIVSRSQFPYADSIDQFPFDSVDCFNNTVNDVDFQNFSSDVEIQGCTLETMIINCNNHTGIEFKRLNYKGNNGVSSPNAEIYIVGNDVEFENVTVSGSNTFLAYIGTYFDSLGDGCYIYDANFGNLCAITVNGHTNLTIGQTDFGSQAGLNVNGDNSSVYQSFFEPNSYVDSYSDNGILRNTAACSFGANSYVKAVNRISNCRVDVFAQVDTTSGSLNNSYIGVATNYTPTGNETDKNIININGVTYELGVTGGAVTATAV